MDGSVASQDTVEKSRGTHVGECIVIGMRVMGGDGNIPPSSVAAPVHFPPHMGFCKLGRSVDRFGNKGKRIGYGFVDNQAMDVACGKRGVVMLLKQQGLCKRSQTEPILLEKQSECFVGHRLWIIGIEIASRYEALSGDLFVCQLQLAKAILAVALKRIYPGASSPRFAQSC